MKHSIVSKTYCIETYYIENRFLSMKGVIMIYTLTLNPAIDRTLYIQDFDKNKVNRIESYREDPGGKGINVSKMIYQLGGASVAVIVTGGYSGIKLEEELVAGHINYVSFKTEGLTRTNLKIVDEINHTFTDINEPGPLITDGLLQDIEDFFAAEVKEGDIVVLAGSLPKGVPSDTYFRWCHMFYEKGVKVILDADQQALRDGILGKPFMIKPNQEELENYFECTFNNDLELAKKARELLTLGVETILISQGKQGCLLVTATQIIKYNALDVKVKSTVGAGDSMVAAIAYGLSEANLEGLDDQRLADIVSLGVAASSASIECEGTIMGSQERIEVLKQMVIYKSL